MVFNRNYKNFIVKNFRKAAAMIFVLKANGPVAYACGLVKTLS